MRQSDDGKFGTADIARAGPANAHPFAESTAPRSSPPAYPAAASPADLPAAWETAARSAPIVHPSTRRVVASVIPSESRWERRFAKVSKVLQHIFEMASRLVVVFNARAVRAGPLRKAERAR